MGRYPKIKYVRQDLLKSLQPHPFGAFVRDGKIVTGFRSVNERVPSVNGIVAMHTSAVGKGTLAGTENGAVYRGTGNNGESLSKIYSDGGNSPFIFETYEGDWCAVLMSGKTYTAIQNGALVHGWISYELSCGTMRRGRLFAADARNSYILRWSGPKGFNDWALGISGSGYLNLEPSGGSILDIFDFEDRLVVFRERSIMRFSVYGTPENFKEEDTAVTPDIYRRTAKIIGDSILFFTSGGLMSYRGGRVTKIDGLITEDLQAPTSAYVHAGRYYFICGTSKSLKRPVVFVYDSLFGGYQVIDIPAYFISADNTSVLGYAPSTIYRLYFGYEYILYEVSTAGFDFGTDRRKLITELEIDCDEDIRVRITNGKTSKTLRSVKGRTRLNMRGAEFEVTFSGYGGSVRSAYLTAEVIE